jgi:hypothetical protein
MTSRPLVTVFVIGAIFAASLSSAHAQEAAPAPPPPPEATAPVPPQYPPPGYQQYPPPYQQYPGAPTMYPPQGPAVWPPYIKDWQEGQPVPYGYHPETRARKGLVITGSVLFGVCYILSTLVAAADNGSTYDYNSGTYQTTSYEALWIPVIGPFIQAGKDNNANGDGQMFVLDGLAQAAGVTMLVLGLAYPRKILVRNDLGTISFVPTPMKVGHEGGGFGLVGRF